MTRIHDIAQVAVLWVLFAFLGALTGSVVLLEPKAAAALESATKAGSTVSDGLKATYATEASFSNLADDVSQIADGLASHESAKLAQAQAASQRLNMVLDHADVAVQDLDAGERAATSSIVTVTDDAHATLEDAQSTINAAALQVGNPAIAESLEDIRDSAASMKQSAAQAVITMNEATATATDARKVADHWAAIALAPVSKAKQVALFAATITGRLFGL